jgi:hypothetical protein
MKTLDQWLPHPDYDDVPKVMQPVLDTMSVEQEVWYDLIDEILPRLRKGNKSTLRVVKQTLVRTYDDMQFVALTYAVEKGFGRDEARVFAVHPYMERRSAYRTAMHYGLVQELLREATGGAPDFKKVLMQFNRADATYTAEGWVVPKELHMSPLGLTTIPKIKEARDDIHLNNNQLTSLEGLPDEIYGSLYLQHNKLTNLRGMPRKVGHYVDCEHNELVTLEGAPRESGTFKVSNNFLTDLRGAPRVVHGHFDVADNTLQTLEGAPEKITGDFVFEANFDVTVSLSEMPEVGGEVVGSRGFYFSGWPLRSEAEETTLRELQESGRIKIVAQEKTAGTLAQWLKEPTYDWMPDEIEGELEDNTTAEIWDILIEKVLPALRQGNRQILKGYADSKSARSFSDNQQAALMHAARQGFDDLEAASLLVALMPSIRATPEPLEDISELLEVVFGTQWRGLSQAVYLAMENSGAEWKDGGWYIPSNNNLMLTNMGLRRFPPIVRCGGYISAWGNHFKNLKGLPKKVGKHLYLGGGPGRGGRSLVSLEGSPEEVGGDFDVEGHKLTTLRGGPRVVGGDYNCADNALRSLKGAPHTVEDFECSGNKLTTLAGGPVEVQAHYSCVNNPLKSLRGGPKKVGGVMRTPFGHFNEWPPSSPSDIERARLASTEKSAVTMEQWLKDPDYDTAPSEMAAVLDELSVDQELWYELIDNILPKLRKGDHRWLQEVPALLPQYNKDQNTALIHAVARGFREETVLKLVADAFLQKKLDGEHLPGLFFEYLNKVLDVTGNDVDLESHDIKVLRRRFIEAKATWGKKGWVVPGQANLAGLNLKHLPPFEKVGGSLTCSSMDLTSLEGCPKVVGKTFDCNYNNKLESLTGGPERVGENYLCEYCHLASLKGAPREIPKQFSCEGNDALRSLTGGPRKVGGFFIVGTCGLRNLKGGPVEVGSYVCSGNDFISFEGAPKKVDQNFTCFDNPRPVSLKPLLNSEIGGTVQTSYGVFDEWPPSDLSVLEETRQASVPKTASTVERWLQKPTYDWMPEDVEKELEDNAQAAVWDILIEQTLPALRKGNKRALKQYTDSHEDSAFRGYTALQTQAVFQALLTNFSESDIAQVVVTNIVTTAGLLSHTPNRALKELVTKVYGSADPTTLVHLHYSFVRNAKGTFTPEGWVLKEDLVIPSIHKVRHVPWIKEAHGDLSLGGNQYLESLEGCPDEVGRNFYVHDCSLTSLKHGPKKVGGSYICSGNRLRTLQGAPSSVAALRASNNELRGLLGGPNKVGVDYDVSGNQLTSLQGAPSKVGGDFLCDENKLTNLVGAPETVGRDFSCTENPLASILGAPQKIGGTFVSDMGSVFGVHWPPSDDSWRTASTGKTADWQTEGYGKLSDEEAAAILKQLGEDPGYRPKLIEQGGSAAVYSLSEGSRILKLTTDRSDAQGSLHVLRKPHRALEKVLDVFEVRNGLYGVVAERLTPLSPQDYEEWQQLFDHIRTKHFNLFLVLKNKGISEDWVKKVKEAVEKHLGDETPFAKLRILANLAKALKKLGIHARDIHEDNFMNRGAVPVLMDFGLSKSPKLSIPSLIEEKTAGKKDLDKWLRSPSYDYTPEEIYEEVEGKNGDFYSDLWDELIEKILPSIRRGTYFLGGEIALGEAWIGSYTNNMLKALFYAIEAGYKEDGLFQAVASAYLLSTQKVVKQFLLKSYKKQIEKAFGTTDSKIIDKVVAALNEANAVISPDGWVCKDHIFLDNMKLKKLPTFSSVEGDFSCNNNHLKTLEGAPIEVGGGFNCTNNHLKTLEGAPIEVGGGFNCNNNHLKTLEGAPREVGGHFLCNNNHLKTLEGAPREVGGVFYCYNNQLTTLEGAPRKVGGGFNCYSNQLTSLEGAPREVGGVFYCYNNQLKTLEGAPREVGGDFYCSDNQLKTLEPLLNSKIGGAVKSDLEVFSTWPPPEGTKLTASTAITLEKWLRSPSYDDMPDEVERELEKDSFTADTWDILIEQVLPALRRGNRATLDSLLSSGDQRSALQRQAVWYAAQEGFGMEGLVPLATQYIQEADDPDRAPKFVKDVLKEAYGTYTTSGMTHIRDRIIGLFQAADATYTSDGWVANLLLDLSGTKLKRLPTCKTLVKGAYLYRNDLTSLEGLPHRVGGTLNLEHNPKLKSLRGCSAEVGQSFKISHTGVTSLQGGPTKVGAQFDAAGTKLTSLKGAPQQTGGFNVIDAPLRSLEGSPQHVQGDFQCSRTKIKNLVGGPKTVVGNYRCEDMPNLTSLEGAPEEVGQDFFCTDNLKLTSLVPLLETKVHGMVRSDFGWMDWPPPPTRAITMTGAVGEREKLGGQEKEARLSKDLEAWLRSPTYDYTPDEIYDEVESDVVTSDTWDILIETVLPALRKGNKGTLAAYRGKDFAEKGLTRYQQLALIYAAEDGFNRDDFQGFLVEAVLHEPKVVDYRGWPKTWLTLVEDAFGTKLPPVIKQLKDHILVNDSIRMVWTREGWIVNAPVNIARVGVKYLPRFAEIKGDFNCSYIPLMNLQGAPQRGVKKFSCLECGLTSLGGAPKKIAGEFNCPWNKLTSLRGLPLGARSYVCHNNQLTSLEGMPSKVSASFFCNKNKLTTLRGGPSYVGNEFRCDHNQLTTLRGGPTLVGGEYNCSNNKLTNLEGAPEEVYGHFDCSDNNISALTGVPHKISRNFIATGNPIQSLYPLVRRQVGGFVQTDIGYFDEWPPSDPNMPLTAGVAKDAVSKLEKWLKNPTYDWAPPEIDKQLEDKALSEIWDILIEQVLPKLRRGDKATLQRYMGEAMQSVEFHGFQFKALFYAILEGFNEEDILEYIAETYLHDASGDLRYLMHRVMDAKYFETIFGTSKERDCHKMLVTLVMRAKKLWWEKDGWFVNGNVNLQRMKLKKLPRFSEVTGIFSCGYNNLTSLDGCPAKIGGSFTCSGNPKLTSLRGGPQQVDQAYYANQCGLISLEGAPDRVETLHCRENKLTSLQGCPYLKFSLDVRDNQLPSLKGAPQKLHGAFNCSDNPLTDLEGGPDWVWDDYIASSCQLTSLKGRPRIVEGDFILNGNQLKNLDDSPQEVHGDYRVYNNPLKSLEGARETKIGGSLETDFASYGSWPPSEESSLIISAAIKEAAGPLDRWLKNPTYDWMPPQLDREIEDGFNAEIWDTLIEQILPRLRKGERSTLEDFLGANFDHQKWNLNQIKAILYAIAASDDDSQRRFIADTVTHGTMEVIAYLPRIMFKNLEYVYGTAKLPLLMKVSKALTQWGQTPWEDGGFVTTDSVDLDGLGLTKLPHFSKIGGTLYCSQNKLTSLEGCPRELGMLNCSNNRLTSLQGGPSVVHGEVDCTRNKLVSLQGAPIFVGGRFMCFDNKLKNLKGSPKRVEGSFTCMRNPITSLEGSPRQVFGSFDCSHTQITSLKGSPVFVGGEFFCTSTKLTTLEGAPREIKGNVICFENPHLESLEGLLDTKVGGYISSTSQVFDAGHWPPSPDADLTASVREGARGSKKEEAWLRSPSYDDIPERVTREMEESDFAGEVWDILIADILPALRRGQKTSLPPQGSWKGYTPLQAKAVFYAISEGFNEVEAAIAWTKGRVNLPLFVLEVLEETCGDGFGSDTYYRKHLFPALEAARAHWDRDGWVLEGDFDMEGNKKLLRLPTIKEAKGEINVSNSKIQTLKGCPRIVNGDFSAHHTALKSLEGGPDVVHGDFRIAHSEVNSLKGGPRQVDGRYSASHCYFLTSLEGAPREHAGSFMISNTKRLQSLKGAPQKVGAHFACGGGMLKSLKGGPQEVGQSFVCKESDITSLKGAPQKVGWHFYCNNNKHLETLEGGPKSVGTTFNCTGCPKLKSLKYAPTEFSQIESDFGYFREGDEDLKELIR